MAEKNKKNSKKREKGKRGAQGEKKKNHGRYWEGIGRRKTAVARVRIFKGSGAYKVNDKNLGDFFKDKDIYKKVEKVFKKVGQTKKFDLSVKIYGGGKKSQIGALVQGIALSLVKINETYKKALKKEGFLTRDPRMKERKKYGLKRARRAPQWSKR